LINKISEDFPAQNVFKNRRSEMKIFPIKYSTNILTIQKLFTNNYPLKGGVMKKLFFALSLFFMAAGIIAQPTSFKYQTVVRDSEGEIVAVQQVSFQLKILQGSASGLVVYTETHSTTTNQFGLANLDIGGGTVVSGDFATIDWGADDYFLEISFDITGGTNYLLAGTSQLMAVPYALYAENSGSSSAWQASGNNIYFNEGNVGIGTDSPGSKLDVHGATRFTVRLNSESKLKVGNLYSSDDTLALVSMGNAEISIDDNDNSIGKTFRVVHNGDEELMRVQEDGRVGIGTNNPERLLHLVGGDARIESPEWCDLTIRTTQPGTDAFLALRVATDGAYPNDNYWGFYNDASDANKLSVLYNGTNKFTIANDGKVGVGTTNPTKLLQVEGDALFTNSSDCFVTVQTIAGSNSGIYLRKGLVGTHWGIINQSGDLEFNKYYSGVESKRMVLTPTGNLGIGVENPDSKLQVNGKIKASEMGIVSAGDATLSIERFTDSHGGIKFFETGDTQAQWMFPFFRGWESDNLIIRDEKHYKDVMTFEYGTGRVGIGTSNPTHTLSVNGTIRSKEVIVNTGWSDFVFEDDYKLMPLNELEKFIEENNHLPEIPSAKEVEENGVSLGNMDSKLLQKIEELTLYILKQQKDLDDLVAKNREIEKRLKALLKAK
jgi:hypothetical protein